MRGLLWCGLFCCCLLAAGTAAVVSGDFAAVVDAEQLIEGQVLIAVDGNELIRVRHNCGAVNREGVRRGGAWRRDGTSAAGTEQRCGQNARGRGQIP